MMGRKKPSPIGETIENAAGDPIGHRSVYGVHSWEYADAADRQPSAIERVLNKEKELVEAARSALKEAGEESDLEAVAGIADPMTESDVLSEWFEAIAARSYQDNTAFLSRPVIAARFLHALHMLRIPPPVVHGFDAVEVGIASHLATAAYYADAYYLWRFECSGDHDKAFSKTVIADAASRGLAKIATKSETRQAIIIREVGRWIDDAKVTAGSLAEQHFGNINKALAQKGLPLIKSEKALIKALHRIRRQRKAAG
jgi:hypothetical protein